MVGQAILPDIANALDFYIALPGSEQRLLTASYCDRLIKMEGDDWYNPSVLLLLAAFPIVPHGFGKRG